MIWFLINVICFDGRRVFSRMLMILAIGFVEKFELVVMFRSSNTPPEEPLRKKMCPFTQLLVSASFFALLWIGVTSFSVVLPVAIAALVIGWAYGAVSVVLPAIFAVTILIAGSLIFFVLILGLSLFWGSGCPECMRGYFCGISGKFIAQRGFAF